MNKQIHIPQQNLPQKSKKQNNMSAQPWLNIVISSLEREPSPELEAVSIHELRSILYSKFRLDVW